MNVKDQHYLCSLSFKSRLGRPFGITSVQDQENQLPRSPTLSKVESGRKGLRLHFTFATFRIIICLRMLTIGNSSWHFEEKNADINSTLHMKFRSIPSAEDKDSRCRKLIESKTAFLMVFQNEHDRKNSFLPRRENSNSQFPHRQSRLQSSTTCCVIRHTQLSQSFYRDAPWRWRYTACDVHRTERAWLGFRSKCNIIFFNCN